MIERLNPQQTNTRAHFVSTYNINVAAVVVTIQQFLPLLSIQPDPRIINLSSQTGSLQYAATTTHFLTGERGYSVSKAALNRITIDLAKLYPQIGFYCVCPGFCKTNLNGYQGVKSPVEGARMVEELVVAERGKYGFGFYAFEDGQVINHDW
jgi:NAD(P)-dependent dehydrogenase (short-subunit alcohol dehydrogenase family)